MNIGTLEIQMAMDMARLRQDMAEAKSTVGGAMDGINKVIGLAKTAFVAFAGVAGVSAFAGMVNGAIEAEGALYDMSKATGMSVSALREFREIGAYTETSAESIAAATLKLSKNLALTDEDGKGAALAIKALGLDFDTFAKMKPDERMLAAAKALDQFEDGSDKSAVAMMLFGKEGAKLIPFFGDLAASSDEISGALTEQQKATRAAAAAMADDYGDNLTKIQKQGEHWKRDLALGLLPMLAEMTGALVDVGEKAGGLKGVFGQLTEDGLLVQWARNVVTGFTYILDVTQGLLSLFPMLFKAVVGTVTASVQFFGGLGASIRQFIEGDYSKSLDTMKDTFKTVGNVGVSVGEDIADIWNQKLIGESFRDSMTSLRGVQAEGREAKRQMDVGDVLRANEAAKKAEAAATKAAAEEQKKLIAAYEAADKAGQDLIASLTLKNEQMQLEVDYGRKLTAVETENIKLTNDLASGKVLLSQAGEEAARAAIEHGAALERESAWQAESHKANLALIDSTDKLIESLQAETEKQRAANEEMGLTTEQLGDLRRAKLEDLAVQAERKAALLDEIDWTGQLGDQQRELAKAYRDSAAVAGDGTAAKAAKEAQDAWGKTIDSIGQGLSDSLFRAFESGKGFWDTLWDGIKNTVKSTVLKVVIQGVDGKGGVAGSIMQLLGLGGQSAGGGGGLLGSVGQLLGLGGSVAGLAGLGSAFMGGAGLALSGAGGTGLALEGAGAMISNGAWGQGLAQGAGALAPWAAGIGLGVYGGRAISGGYSSLGGGSGNTAVNAGTAIGAIFGGPIGAALGGAIGGLVNRAFGRKAKEVGAYGVEGSFGAGDFGGRQYSEWRQEGGWFRSDKSGTDYSALTADQAALLDESAAQVYQQVKQWAAVLQLPATQLAQVTSNIKLQFGSDDTANATAISNAIKGYQDALSNTLAGSVQPFAKAGESVAATLARLAGLEVFSKSFTDFGGIFDAIAASSFHARDSLYELAGGMEAFAAKATNFIDLYYSDAEKAAVTALNLRKQLADAGINADDLSTRAQYRALVDGTDVSTEAGRKQLVALLDAASQFADVAKYLEEAGGTLASLALGAPADSQVVGLLTEPAQASALAAQQSAELLATATDQLASISDNGAASVRVQQAGFTQLIERVDALAEAISEVVRPGQLAEMAR